MYKDNEEDNNYQSWFESLQVKKEIEWIPEKGNASRIWTPRKS